MSNRLNAELTNKVVLVKRSVLKPGIDNRFLCEGGFGCNANTNGTKVYGRWVSDNQEDQIGGYDIERFEKE